METTPSSTPSLSLSRHDFFRLVGASVGALFITPSLASCAAKDDDPIAPSTDQKVDFTIRMSDKGNENLKVKGGYVVANNIIIAQTKDEQFVAVAAECTCGTPATQLVFKSADSQFYCPLHLSRFDTAGKVLMGPATKALAAYTVNADTTAGTVHVHS